MAQGLNSYTSRGGNSDAMAARKKTDAETWANMLKMINTTTPETMLGYGLGKLLRGAYDHMVDRRAERAGSVQPTDDGTGVKPDVQAGTQMPPTTITMPNGTTVDLSKVLSQSPQGDGTLQGGMLGAGFPQVAGDGITKVTHKTTSPNGATEETTATQPYAFGGKNINLSDMAAAMNNDYSFNPNMLMDGLKKPIRFF